MAMTLEIKGNKLCKKINLEKPVPSVSGTTLLIASSKGNSVNLAKVGGITVTIGLNVYIRP